MNFSIRIALATLALAALTFASVAAGPSTVAFQYYSLAITSLLMAASTALPIVCSRSTRPFWAGYAVTTGYALIVRGFENDPFHGAIYLPLQALFGDAALQTEGTLGSFVSGSIHLWHPSLIGLAGGVIFALAFRVFHRQTNDE